MTVSRQLMAAGQQPMGNTSELASVAQLVDVILDKGIVIDAWVRVSVVGLEILTIEARVVVTSVDTYLRYAEAIGRIAHAAPPVCQQTASGGKKEQERGLEGDVLHRLSEHLQGLQPASLQALLGTPVEQLREILSQLAGEQKVRRDEEHNLYLPGRE